MLQDHCIFCWRKKRDGFGLIQYVSNLSIWENYLVVFVCPIICSRTLPTICHAGKNILKNHGRPEFALGLPLGGGPDENSRRPWNLIHSPPCRTPCRLFIHEIFFGPLGLHLRVWSELRRSPPFQPMTSLKLQWSRAFSLVCEVALSYLDHPPCQPVDARCHLHKFYGHVDTW